MSAPTTTQRPTDYLRLRMLGESFTLYRTQWDQLLDELRPDSELAGRIRDLLACDHEWGAERDHPELGVYQRCERCGDYRTVEQTDAVRRYGFAAVRQACVRLGLPDPAQVA